MLILMIWDFFFLFFILRHFRALAEHATPEIELASGMSRSMTLKEFSLSRPTQGFSRVDGDQCTYHLHTEWDIIINFQKRVDKDRVKDRVVLFMTQGDLGISLLFFLTYFFTFTLFVHIFVNVLYFVTFWFHEVFAANDLRCWRGR